MLDYLNGFTVDKNRKFAHELERAYPFLSCDEIGKSRLGHGIFSFSVGKSDNSVLLVGGMHGCHKVLCLILYKFLDELCHSILLRTAISSVHFSRLYDKYGFTVVPCINPDSLLFTTEEPGANMPKTLGDFSCENRASFRANAAGVDIDKNFTHMWKKQKLSELKRGAYTPSSHGFCGPFALSEPESRALVLLCRQRHFRSCLTIFGKDEKEEICYDKTELDKEKTGMAASILSCVTGIDLCQSSTQNHFGSFNAFFSSEFRRPSFSMKIDTNCTDFTAFDKTYRRIEEGLVLFGIM